MTNLEKYVLLLNPANDEFTQRKTNKNTVRPNLTVTTSLRKSEPRGRFANPKLKSNRHRERETAACETLPRVIYPRYGRNRNDEYRW